MRKKTLTFKLVVTMTIIVAGTIFLSWFLNNTFLEKIYENNKQKALISAYKLIADAYEKGELENSSFLLDFQKACTNDNLDIIATENGIVVIASTYDKQQLLQKYYDIVEGLSNRVDSNELISTEKYVITKQYDPQMQDDYLILYGVAGKLGEIYMRTPIRSMKESAAITSMFLGVTGIIVLLISVIVIIILSRNISKPLKYLSILSQKITSLQFEEKYFPSKSSSREIDELGNNINVLSDSLQRTIAELKGANNELLRDIEKKEQIDDMRKEFLSNVSHELKTPLALIQGYAEGLKEGISGDKESQDFYCEVIMDEADKMNHMVKKLLTLNQLEFGNELLEMQRFDICELVEGVLGSMEVLLKNNELCVEHIYDLPKYVWGDVFMIEEVVTNYLSNAIHYANGEKRIQIRYEERENCLRMLVYNSGDHIPEAEIDKIWDKFYKVDKARTREYGGSGIGLSIVKAIMDLHNMSCGVSNCAYGVEFWIDLETNY